MVQWNARLQIIRYVRLTVRKSVCRKATSVTACLPSVCCLSVTLVHTMQTSWTFCNIVAPSNSVGTRAVCVKIFSKILAGFSVIVLVKWKGVWEIGVFGPISRFSSETIQGHSYNGRRIGTLRDAMQARPIPSCGVCLSVCLSRSWILSKRVIVSYRIFKFFSLLSSQTILVLPHQMSWQYFDGISLNGGVERRWGRHKSRFWANSWLSINDCCWTWEQQLRPTTMQCIAQTAMH